VLRRLLYASYGYSSHDHRFMSSAARAGWLVHHLRFDGGSSSLCAEPCPAGVLAEDWLGSHVRLDSKSHEQFVEAIVKVADRVQPHVVHAGPLTTVAPVVASARLKPLLVMSWASDLLLDSPQSAQARQAAEWSISAASAVLVDAKSVADEAIAHGAQPDLVSIVPWGVDLDRFPVRDPQRLGHPLRLLCLRSHEPLYDVGTLIEALAYVHARRGPIVELDIVGSGSLTSNLMGLADRLGVSHLIKWHGRVAEIDVANHLNGCHLHVSTSPIDGTSISLLQAMASGRPSVVVDNASNREWIEDGATGWLYEAGNASGLADCIFGACDALETFPQMGRAARDRVETDGDWTSNRLRVLDIYDRLLVQAWPDWEPR